MSLFKKYLADSETIFKNEASLDPNFTPRGPIEFRENENKYIAACIKPLFQRHSGKNLLIHGPPGIGKTLACLKIKEELENTTDEILVFYINLWKKNTPYKIILELCEQLGYKFTQNKAAEELFEVIKQKINQKSAVFILDEADKAESLEILYSLAEDIYRKVILLITNDKTWTYKLDPRLRSRLLPDVLEFKAYTKAEIAEILKKRVDNSFYSNVFSKPALNLISEKTFEIKDIRIGLFLLKESGLIAETNSLKSISLEHAQQAILKIDNFQKPLSLTEEEESILKTIYQNPDKSVQDIFEVYQHQGNSLSNRTFHRRLKNLEKAKLIEFEEITGLQGRSYKIKPTNTKLSDF